MKKKIIIFLVIVILIAAIVVGCLLKFGYINLDNDSEDKTDTQEETIQEDDETLNIIKKYSKYLEENIFNDDIEEINGLFIDFNSDNILELIIKKDNNSKLQILYINGDNVNKSNEYNNSNVVALYEVDTETSNYYINYDQKNILIDDIVNQKSTITEIEQDEKFAYTYVLVDLGLSYYTISKDSIKSDLEKIQEKYSTEIISEASKTEALTKIEEIKNNTLTMAETGIKNSKYTLAYGTYVCGGSTVTLNKDYSMTLSNGTWSGNYYLEYDTIHTNMGGVSDMKITIIGNNQFKTGNSIYNLK